MKKSAPQTGRIAKSAGAVGIAVMCSRILGLIREQIFAGMFGAGYAYDAFVVAFRIPNLLRDLFGEGALSAAFVTVFSDYDTNRSQEETWKLASNVLIFFAILLSLVSLVGIYLAGPIVSILAPDFSAVEGKAELTRLLTIIMLPFLVFISLAAVVMGVLNTKGKFFIPAMASSFFNLGSIVGGVSLALILPSYNQPAIVGMAIGTLIGGVLQLGIQLPWLFKAGFRFTMRLRIKDPGLKRIMLLMLPATIGLSATQINIFINTSFAASCIEGSVSWLNYAFRLVQLPIGIFGVALSIATMPVLARYAAKKDLLGMRTTFVSSMSMVLCLSIPASAGLILLAEPIIGLIFERGAFTALDTAATAQALSLYALGLFAYSANKILVPVFYALNCTRYPVIGSFLTVAANILIITLTIDTFQHRAIALSTSLTMLFNFIFLSTILYWKLGGYSLRYLLTAICKIIIATAAMVLFLLSFRDLASTWLSGSLIQRAISTLTIIACAGALYGIILHLLKVPELTDITSQIKARFN